MQFINKLSILKMIKFLCNVFFPGKSNLKNVKSYGIQMSLAIKSQKVNKKARKYNFR